MPNKQAGTIWWASSKESESDAEFYNALAERCEQLDPSEQRAGFESVLIELAIFGQSHEGAQKDVASQWIRQLADAGAFESAAVAMIPASATFTGGRMKDGNFIAQVILEGSAGAHSRNAQSLAMAWLAALLRAFARQSAETKGANTH